VSEVGSAKVTEDQVSSILKVRRDRSGIFGEGLFSDPAWDILLELLAARLGNRKLLLSELDKVAPKSVLARWTAELEERGLVTCELNRFRPDQFWLALSDNCAGRMIQFLSSARHLAGLNPS
jgi:hypothetical protein